MSLCDESPAAALLWSNNMAHPLHNHHSLGLCECVSVCLVAAVVVGWGRAACLGVELVGEEERQKEKESRSAALLFL